MKQKGQLEFGNFSTGDLTLETDAGPDEHKRALIV